MLVYDSTAITLKELMANSSICHGDMTGKRGENVTEVNIDTIGMSIFLLPMEFYVLAGKYLHYSTFDDIIMLHH